MLERYLTKHLREGEVVLEVVRRSPVVVAGRLSLAAALFLAGFFFLVPLLRQGSLGWLGFLGLVLGGTSLGVRTLLVWALNAFVLTDERIVDIDQRGFFTTVVSSARYEKIQDVSYAVRGFWQTVFHLGTVEVQTAGTELRLALAGVREPKRIQERISGLVAERTRQARQATADEMVAVLERKAERAPPSSTDR